MEENEKLVARTRDLAGDSVEIMLDCWMAFDVEYTVRLAERLRPYRLKWMEECLIPEDLDAHVELRQRLPWQSLATGEHWYTPLPFSFAVRHRCVDVLQPDICWCGGLTACLRIAHLAEASGVAVILHGGGNTHYGQHFTFAMPSAPWAEVFVGSPPGVPLAEAVSPGVAVPQDGWLAPHDAPGFGLEVRDECLSPLG
jgi:L-rhamnonate dehydratase